MIEETDPRVRMRVFKQLLRVMREAREQADATRCTWWVVLSSGINLLGDQFYFATGSITVFGQGWRIICKVQPRERSSCS